MDRKLNILLVEDLDSDADLLEYQLQKSGFNYTIKRVDNENDFTEILNDHKHTDIILADYSLPQFSGLKALKIAKKLNEDIPFILVTGTQSEEVAVDCIKQGADDYILKSSLTRLPSAIKNSLETATIKKQKKNIESELIKSEEKYRLITECSQDLIALMDESGVCLYASPSYYEILGYPHKELVGINLFDYIHPEDKSDVINIWLESVENKDARDAEFRYRHKNGNWLYFETRGNWITENNTAKKALLVSRDITSRILMNEKLRRERDYNRKIIEETPAIVCGVAPDGTTNFMNRTAVQITGYEPHELIGKNWFTIMYPGDLYTQIDEFYKIFEKDKFIRDFEATLLHKNGELKTVLWNGFGKYDKKGDLVEIIGFGYDITEIMHSQEKILNSLKEKELLIKEIHHRVKNNLQVISSIFYLQSEKVTDPSIHEIMEECKNRVNSMALIHENFYQSDDLVNIDFKEYLENLVSNLQMSHGNGNDHLININLNIDSILLNIDVAIPCGLLVNELVSNAFKHAFPNNRKGKIYIDMHRVSEEEMILKVKDDGVGLPEDFDLEKTETLGMEIINTLINQFEGELNYINDNGAEFIVKLKA